jgi:amino acid transporter
MPRLPRRFLGGLAGLLISWFGIRSLGTIAGGWPWSENPSKTILVSLLLAVLIAAFIVSMAVMMGGMVRVSSREQQPRR